MPSNVTLKFNKIWIRNFCSDHIQIKFTVLKIRTLKRWKFKTQTKLFKLQGMDWESNILFDFPSHFSFFIRKNIGISMLFCGKKTAKPFIVLDMGVFLLTLIWVGGCKFTPLPPHQNSETVKATTLPFCIIQ